MSHEDRWQPAPVPLGDGRHDIGDDTRAAIFHRLHDDFTLAAPWTTAEQRRQLAMLAAASVRALLHELGALREMESAGSPPRGFTPPEGSQVDGSADPTSCLSCCRLEGERDQDSAMIASLLKERDEAREAAALWRDQLAAAEGERDQAESKGQAEADFWERKAHAAESALADAQAKLAERVWQPIASAPKDTRVLAWFPRFGALCAVKISNTGTWVGQALERVGDPMYWMPLPPAPSAALSPDPIPVRTRHDEKKDDTRRDVHTASGPTGSSRSPQPEGSALCRNDAHRWDDEADAEGDTCNCGAWYRFANRIEGTR